MRPKKSFFYVFRRPITKNLHLTKYNKNPHDLYYGLTKIKKFNLIYTDEVFKHKFLLFFQYYLNLFVSLFYKSGFSIIPTLLLIPKLNIADCIFATVDTYGLPIALLKKLGFIKPKIILNTIGMYDGLIKSNNPISLFIIRNIINQIDHIVSGGSFSECKLLSKMLRIPINRFSFIPFGIDTQFFYKKSIKSTNEILTIGADIYRNWDLFFQVVKYFPNEKFRVITHKGLIKTTTLNNVIFEYNVNYETLRKRVWQSKFVLLLTKTNHYFSGQSTAFRCMSCEKPVIFTKTSGVGEYQFINYKHCVVIPPYDFNSAILAINKLNKSQSLREKIGRNARKIIKSKYNIKMYANKLEQVFKKIIYN